MKSSDNMMLLNVQHKEKTMVRKVDRWASSTAGHSLTRKSRPSKVLVEELGVPKDKVGDYCLQVLPPCTGFLICRCSAGRSTSWRTTSCAASPV